MPQIIPAAMAAFAAIKSAVAVITAVKVLGVTLATWGKIAMWTAMGASMLMKPPGLPSAGVQVNLQPAGPNAPLPIVIGRTGVQGFITYREAYPDAVHNSSKNNKLCFETVLSVGPVKSISNYTLTGHRINWDREPTRLGSSTGVSICRSVTGFDSKSSVWRDGVRAAFILGEHNDTRTLRTITGDSWLPKIGAIHGMAGLARIVQVFELDGSKNLRFPSGFPDRPQAVVEGVYTYDPRQDSTFPGGFGSQRIDQPSTWGWSENPYIAALAYALGRNGPTGQKMWGIGADADDIDIPAFIHGANVADANGWKIGGMVTTDDSKDAVLSNLLVAGAGQYLPGPQISCFVNEPKVSTFTLRQNMLVGDQVIRATRPMKSRFNRILVKYREPNSNYEIVTGQEVSDAGYIAADGGLRTTETTYPLVQQATQAHQIAAYELVNSREYEIDVTTTAEALAVERGDLITLDFPIGAIESQNFIVKNWSFNAGQQTVSMTLVSETAGKHDFALGRTATAPAPAQLKSFAALNPSAPDATDWTLVANQIVQPRPVVEVEEGEEPPVPLAPVVTPAFVFEGGATDPAVSAVVVEMRAFDANRSTRLPGESDEAYEARQDEGWVVAFEAAPNATRLIVSDVSPATTYDIAIRYRSNLNVTSPRLVYGGRATGNLSFDWNDPNVIVGVPPILRDTAFLDALKPALGDLDNAIADLGNAVIDMGEEVANATAIVEGVQDRIDGVWEIVGEDDASGIRARLIAVESNSVGEINAVVERVDGLEVAVGDAVGRITTIEGAVADLDGTYVKAERIDQIDATIAGQGGRLTSVETVANDAKNGLVTVNQTLQQKANQGDLTALQTRVSATEVVANSAAKSSDLVDLKAVVNHPTNGLSATNSRLNLAEVEIGKRALTSTTTALGVEINTERGRITNALGRLDSVDVELGKKATLIALQTLSGELVTERGRINSTNTLLNQVKITADGAATNQSVSSLTQTVNGQTNSITQAMTIAQEANGRSKSIVGFQQETGGVISGMVSTNDGFNPKIVFKQNVFEIQPASGNGASLSFTGAEGLKIGLNGVTRFHFGFRNV